MQSLVVCGNGLSYATGCVSVWNISELWLNTEVDQAGFSCEEVTLKESYFILNWVQIHPPKGRGRASP